MSIQADTEILSIQAIEAYANKNHISGKEASDIFHQYHVIEKIMIQHEYLHQISFEEVMEAIQLYIAGILSADETVERLRYNKVNNQISFHTEKALESLEFIRRLAYE